MTCKLDSRLSDYMVKQLLEEDVPDILRLCEGNPVYYKYMKMQPSIENLTEVLTALPEGKSMDNKHFYGFYNGSKLVAILDLITEYPDKDTVFIGWFILNKDFQRTGIGTRIITEILSYLKNKFRYVRLGYIKGNQQSENFWIKNKFSPTGEESQTEDYTIVIMQKEI